MFDFGPLVKFAILGMVVGVPTVLWFGGKLVFKLALALWRGW